MPESRPTDTLVGQLAALLREHVRTLRETSPDDPEARAASAAALAQRDAMTVLGLYARAWPDQPVTPLAIGTLLGCGMHLALRGQLGVYRQADFSMLGTETVAAAKRITLAVADQLQAGRG